MMTKAILEPLGEFARCPASLLEQRTLQRRTDTKFLVGRKALVELLPRLARDYGLVYAGEAPVASYETLYFDTDDLLCFNDHRRGRRERHKVRIRHYPEREVSFLEVKTKGHDGVTRKWRSQRAFGNASLGDDDLARIAANSAVPAERLTPQMWTNFRRLTLVGLHTSERLTLDFGLTFRRAGHDDHELDVGIIEVKQAPFSVRTPAMLALRKAGLRPASASKYCVGTLLTRGGLRANRFLPTLRIIERLQP